MTWVAVPSPRPSTSIRRGSPPVDQEYRVGARISVGDVGRTWLAGAIAIGIVLIEIALAATGPLLPPVPELSVAPVTAV